MPSAIIKKLPFSTQRYETMIRLIIHTTLLLLLIPSHLILAKVTSGKAVLSGEKTEALLTKFAISAHTSGSLDLKLTIPTSKGMYTDERFLKVHFFADKAWTVKASKAATCSEKIKFASFSLPVTFNYGKEGKEDVWIANVQTKELYASESVQYWYISLDDCSLEQFFHNAKDVPEMTYTIDIKNGKLNGEYTHYSADELGMNKLHLAQILTSSALLLCVAMKLFKSMMSAQGQVHIALITVGCAIQLDILSNLSEMIHAGYYSINGIGIYTFDCLASHFEAQCDALIALVLILVGSGWTLPSDVIVKGTEQNMSLLGTNSIIQKLVASLRSPTLTMHQLKSGNPASVLLFSVILSHAILAQWGRTFDEEFDSYHALDHIAGKAVAFFRVGLGLIFLVGAASVRNSGRCPPSLQPFLTKFQFVGLSWFLSLPFVSMSSSLVPYHRQHLMMASGSAMVQACSLASLVWLFCADVSASAYHRVSTLSRKNTSLSDSSSNDSGGGRMWKIGKTKIRLD